MPQHTWPSGSSQAMPLRSHTPTVAFADVGLLVLDEARREERDRSTVGRGSPIRCARAAALAEPLREADLRERRAARRSLGDARGLLHQARASASTSFVRFTSGANVVGDLALQVGAGEEHARPAAPCPPVAWIASDRSMRRGKSITHSCPAPACTGRRRSRACTGSTRRRRACAARRSGTCTSCAPSSRSSIIGTGP